MKKIVSIVIPIFNEEKYIEKCLKSVITQDFPEDQIEILLIDGMSEDKTPEIIRKYAQSYNFIRI
jgi:glycosyltransferase involved in cell wall biosynthesis